MRIVAAAALAAIVGCSSTADPRVNRVVGAIVGYTPNDPQIDVAVDGRTVDARILTYGSPCDSPADTEVRQSGAMADVTVYDYRMECAERSLLTMEHHVTIHFPDAGTVQLIVHGVDASTRSSTNPTGDPSVAQQQVVLK